MHGCWWMHPLKHRGHAVVQLSAALERVRAGADVMPQQQLEQVMSAELGEDWRKRLASFEDEPLAAASIGQVALSLSLSLSLSHSLKEEMVT